MTFVAHTQVRFAHVDAAGIVFYPRYFEMINGAVEDFFADIVGVDFNTLHVERGLGVPTVKLESEFLAPARLGDLLDIAVTVDRCGHSSATLSFDVSCKGRLCLTVRSVIVCMDLKSANAIAWPQAIRACLSPRPHLPAYASGTS